MTSTTTLIDSMEAYPLLALLVFGIIGTLWIIYFLLAERIIISWKHKKEGAKSK